MPQASPLWDGCGVVSVSVNVLVFACLSVCVRVYVCADLYMFM